MGTPQDVQKGLDLFRTLVFDNAVEAAIVAYEGPFLAIPVIGPVGKAAEEVFADYLYKQLAGQIVFETALFTNLAHRKAFAAASNKLQQIAIDKGIDSEEFKNEHAIEKEALKAFGQFSAARP